MKRFIIVTILLMAGVAGGAEYDPMTILSGDSTWHRGAENYNIRLPGDNPAPYTKNDTMNEIRIIGHSKIGTPEAIRAEQIREWAASGEICRVLGHRWRSFPIVTINTLPEGSCYPERRYCFICGKTENRTMGEWR